MKSFFTQKNQVLLIAAFIMLFFACEKDKGGGNGGGSSPSTVEIADGSTLNGILKSGATAIIKEGYNVKLSGEYIVEDGAVLKIEKGVKITALKDETVDYILIKQGGKIDAQGTAEKPIVMTAEVAEGDVLKTVGWGGLHICGRAHTNKGVGCKSEIGNALYGNGTSTEFDNDNSGILRYIRLEYTGFALDEEHESNGISFYGVGNGTTVEYIQVYKGGDDGFEFFGGSVNAKYLIATDCEDDSFDWTEGWNGKAQFLVATQTGTSGLKDNGDCLIEADNNGDNNNALPISHPILSNLTLVGNNSAEGKRGVRLRAGTEVELYNTLVTGKAHGISVETTNTENALLSEKSKLKYVLISEEFNSKESIYTAEMFNSSANNNQTAATIELDDTFVGVVKGGMEMSDPFFTKVSYIGAVDPTTNWAKKTWVR